MALFGTQKQEPAAQPGRMTGGQNRNVLMDQMHPQGKAQAAGEPTARVAAASTSGPIGKDQVNKAYQTMLKYKEGKTNLEQRIIDNEKWYKLRHWETLRKKENQDVEPSSGWLFNCLANKHADAMDNFPSPNFLPREEGDREEARMLSSVVPVVLDQAGFEETYDRHWDSKLHSGTGVYGVFWDPYASNGLGEILIKEVDLLNLFWEPGVTDIQMSRNLFHVELWELEVMEEKYPDLAGKLSSGGSSDVSSYEYDDNVETSDKVLVVDWYYKREIEGRQILHYCKFTGDNVLFATENEAEFAQAGWYRHGRYPFEFDTLFRLKGTPCGFGYIDVAKSAQEYIDRGNQAIMENMMANAAPRYFFRTDGGVNEQEYADTSKKFVHVDGNLGEDSIKPIQGKPLNGIYVSVLNNKIDELKETTGNRDISTGGSVSGVTAASAIAAMQEAGSKLSRDHIKASYRCFRKVCELVVEMIRQFYDLPRCFRILGENGSERYVTYSNAGLQEQSQGTEFGVDMGFRTPLFDIEITAQKQSPYSRMSQNELALQFFREGFFNPQVSDQALAALDMMDFDRKDFVMQRIAQNAQVYQQTQMMQQMAMMGMADPRAAMMAGVANPAEPMPPRSGGEEPRIGAGESSVTKNARQRVADATSPA